MAEALKTLGNEAFKNNDFAKAIEHFTEAIGIDGTNHVLYSNRSAARVRYIDETFFFFFRSVFRSSSSLSLSLSLCVSLFFFFLFLERSCEGGACRAFY
jgi:hypothetical protein